MAERTIKTVRIVPGSALEALSRVRSFTDLVHELAEERVRNTLGELPMRNTANPSGIHGIEDLSDLA